MSAKALRPQKQPSEQVRKRKRARHDSVEEARRVLRAKKANQQSAPFAVPFEQLDILAGEDVRKWGKLFGHDFGEHESDMDASRLNGAISEYLRDAPQTVGRDAELTRYAWYSDVLETAHHLWLLLHPLEHSALLLSGVGQPMLWMASLGAPRRTLVQWEAEMSAAAEALKMIGLPALRGRDTLERHLLRVETAVSGHVSVTPETRVGRPHELSFRFLAEEFVKFWEFLSGEKATVRVTWHHASDRRSDAADFVAAAFDTVSARLEPRHGWARSDLKGATKRLVVYIGNRNRANRKKRKTG